MEVIVSDGPDLQYVTQILIYNMKFKLIPAKQTLILQQARKNHGFIDETIFLFQAR